HPLRALSAIAERVGAVLGAPAYESVDLARDDRSAGADREGLRPGVDLSRLAGARREHELLAQGRRDSEGRAAHPGVRITGVARRRRRRGQRKLSIAEGAEPLD